MQTFVTATNRFDYLNRVIDMAVQVANNTARALLKKITGSHCAEKKLAQDFSTCKSGRCPTASAAMDGDYHPIFGFQPDAGTYHVSLIELREWTDLHFHVQFDELEGKPCGWIQIESCGYAWDAFLAINQAYVESDLGWDELTLCLGEQELDKWGTRSRVKFIIPGGAFLI